MMIPKCNFDFAIEDPLVVEDRGVNPDECSNFVSVSNWFQINNMDEFCISSRKEISSTF